MEWVPAHPLVAGGGPDRPAGAPSVARPGGEPVAVAGRISGRPVPGPVGADNRPGQRWRSVPAGFAGTGDTAGQGWLNRLEGAVQNGAAHSAGTAVAPAPAAPPGSARTAAGPDRVLRTAGRRAAAAGQSDDPASGGRAARSRHGVKRACPLRRQGWNDTGGSWFHPSYPDAPHSPRILFYTRRHA